MNIAINPTVTTFLSMCSLIISLAVGLVLIGSFSCSPAIPIHETERLKKLESSLAPYVLPAKFDEELVEHFNLRNERISKLAEILEPHDIKLQVSEQALQQSFQVNGLSGFTIQRTVDNCLRDIGGGWLYDDKTVFLVMDPREFDRPLLDEVFHVLGVTFQP